MMADSDISGFWKGLTVSRVSQNVVYIHLEQDGNSITGVFEAPQSPDQRTKGDVTGSIEGSAITLQVAQPAERGSELSKSSVLFQGTVVGTAGNQMIYGTLQTAESGSSPGGTATFFRPARETFVADMYKASAS
jgi:hypothetical protein